MAPNVGLDLFTAYQASESKFTTWLVENAIRCNVEVQKTEHSIPQIPHSEFKKMATAIMASTTPKISVPSYILAFIRHVVSFRKHASTFFSGLASAVRTAKFDRNNAGQQHYIKVLEEVYNILVPDGKIDKGDGNDSSISDMFAALSVEKSASEGTAPAKSSTKVAGEVVKYVPEEIEFDQAFAMFAFFQGIDNIRNYLKSVWTDYRDGKLDCMSAAVTTDTGFTQIRRSCEALSQSRDFLETKRSRDFVTLEWEGSIDYFIATKYLVMYLDEELEDAIGEWTCSHASKMLISFAQTLHPKHVLGQETDRYGPYNPHQNRSELSKKEQSQEDFIVTMKLLPEFLKLPRARAYPPVQDELTTGLRMMMDACDSKRLPMYAIFAFQILLDAHNILRQNTDRPYLDLHGTATRTVSIMDDYLSISRKTKVPGWDRKDDDAFQIIRDLAKEWVLTDKVAQLRVETLGATGKVQPFHLLKNNPVLSGLLMFTLNMRTQEASIALCNASGSALSPAHLYNACQHSAGLKDKWSDIEFVIATHSAKRLFVGTPPTEPSEYLKRFVLAPGGDAVVFARNSRPGGSPLIVESKKGPPGLKTTTPTRDAFKPRYIDIGDPALIKGNLVAMLAVALKAQRTSPTSMDLQELYNQSLKQDDFSRVQVLRIVREGVAAEELHLLFDYIGLHLRSYKLLQTLHNTLQAQLASYFGSNFTENEFQLPFIAGFIFEVMSGSDRMLPEVHVEGAGGRLLQIAAETMRKFLKDRNNSHDSLLTAQSMSRLAQYHLSAGTLATLPRPRDKSTCLTS